MSEEKKLLLNTDNHLDENDVPPLTKWRKMLLVFWVVNEEPFLIRFRYINLHHLPLIEFFLYLFLYYSWCSGVSNKLSGFFGTLLFKILFSIFYFFGLISFLLVYLSDPGFLPFYHPVIKKRKYTLDEIRDGTAYTKEQIEWAKKQERPSRSCFTTSSGRFLLRSDHYCKYVGNWIGLYNHRYFLLALFYMGITVLCYFCVIIYESLYGIYPYSALRFIFELIVSFFFWAFILKMLISQLIFVSHNVTGIEHMKGIDNPIYDHGIISNFEEVCGPRKLIWLWMVPIPLPRTIDGFSFPENTIQEEENDHNIATFKINPFL